MINYRKNFAVAINFFKKIKGVYDNQLYQTVVEADNEDSAIRTASLRFVADNPGYATSKANAIKVNSGYGYEEMVEFGRFVKAKVRQFEDKPMYEWYQEWKYKRQLN
jgi:hypothetical protein